MNFLSQVLAVPMERCTLDHRDLWRPRWTLEPFFLEDPHDKLIGVTLLKLLRWVRNGHR